MASKLSRPTRRLLVATGLGGPASRGLLALSLPIMGIMLSRFAMGFVDVAMVSRLGTEALAAVTPASALVFIVLALGMGLVSSVQTFASQAQGAGDSREGAAYAWQAIYLGLFSSIALFPFAGHIGPFFEWIGAVARHDAAVLDLEIRYASIAILSFAPAVISAGLESWFNGVQKPRICVIANVVSIAFNALGNWVLMYGKLGFPAMGIGGAALATLIGWWLRTAILFVAFVSSTFHDVYGTRSGWRPSWRRGAGVVRIGAPLALTWAGDVLAWNVFLIFIVPRYGPAAMAACNVAIQYLHLSFMPAHGMGLALRTLVGHAIGEGRPGKAVWRTRAAIRMCGLYMGLMGAAMALGREPLLRFFTGDAEVIAIGGTVLIWCAVFQVFDAMAITYSNALAGAGDTRIPGLALIACSWIVFIGGSLAFAHWGPGWGMHGPWIACAAYIALLGILLERRFRAGGWAKMRVIEPTRG